MYISLQSVILLPTPLCHSSPLHSNGCSVLQEGPQLLPEVQKPSPGLPEGFVTAKFSRNFWRHLSCFHAADRHATEIFWPKAIKRHIQLQHRQIISAEPGVHSGHSSSSGTTQPGQVRYRLILTTIPSYSP